MTRSVLLAIAAATAAGCGDDVRLGSFDAAPVPDAEPPCEPADPPAGDCSDPCFDDRGPELRLSLTIGELELPAPPAGSTPVRVGLFYTVAPQPSSRWTRADVAARMRQIVADTSRILAQCDMHVDVEAAQVVSLPARLLDLEGNDEGSFGGHPPPGTPDPDRFDYEQHERLTPESLELFQYGKQHTSNNAIAAFTVEHIVYYANQQPEGAGGLSYPANIYHHPDDFPYRNSVLLVPTYGACGDLPSTPGTRTLAHEIGHMLLNTGGHAGAFNNLMVNGTVLTAAQCETMHANLVRLFGDADVPDPGPPS
jgi:hypothetical protein